MGIGPFDKGDKPIYVAGIESSKDYFSSRRVKRKAPQIKVKISPFIPPFVPIELVSADMGGLIQSLTWEKSRSQPYGTLSFELAADDKKATEGIGGWPISNVWRALGVSLRDVLKPMTMLQLWIDGYHVSTCFIRLVRKRTSAGSGKSYLIEADELGALYDEDIIKRYWRNYGEQLRFIDAPYQILNDVASFEGLPVSSAFNACVNAFLASTFAFGTKGFPTPYWRASDGLPMALRLVAQPAPVGGISNRTFVSQMVSSTGMFETAEGSSFWSYLKGMMPEPYVEMFCESGGRTIVTGRVLANPVSQFTPANLTGIPLPGISITPMLPGFNYMIVRTPPYDNPLIGVSPWYPTLYPYGLGVFDLILGGDFVIITDEDVFEKDLGNSDAQQYTLFETAFTGKGAANESANSWNPPSIASGPTLPIMPGGIRTYGVRGYQANINATSLLSTGLVGATIERHVRRNGIVWPGALALTTLLNSWFRNASKFNEGTIVARDMPWARPGMALLYLPSQNTSRIDDPRDIGTYYIDNLVYKYEIGKNPRTTYSVIRGTPLPLSISNLAHLFMDWEILPPGLNIFDAEF